MKCRQKIYQAENKVLTKILVPITTNNMLTMHNTYPNVSLLILEHHVITPYNLLSMQDVASLSNVIVISYYGFYSCIVLGTNIFVKQS